MRSARVQKARRTDAACVTGCRAYRSAIHGVVDSVVLRMIEQVEIFPAEVECILLAESKALEAEVEVDSARVGQSVAPDVAKRQARRRCIRRGL